MARKPDQVDPPPVLGHSRRVQLGVNAALRRGTQDGFLDAALDAGLVALCRTLAAQIDAHVNTAGDGWLLVRMAAELRETLTRLRLDPTTRGATTDNLDDFLRSLAEPTGPLGDAPQ